MNSVDVVKDYMQKVQEKYDLSEQEVVERIRQSGFEDSVYLPWILRWWERADIYLPEDAPHVHFVLEAYQYVVESRGYRDCEEDVESIFSLVDAIRSCIGAGSKVIIRDPTVLPGVKLFKKVDQRQVYLVEVPESLAVLAEGTDWRVRSFGINNEGLKVTKWYLQMGGGQAFVSWLEGPEYLCRGDYLDVRDCWDEELDITIDSELYDIFSPPIEEGNEVFLYRFAHYVKKQRWLEAEPVILRKPGIAYLYAKDVIMNRWLEAEPVILKDPWVSCLYARDVIMDRWQEAEPIILQDAKSSVEYMICFGLEQDRDFIQAVISDPDACLDFVRRASIYMELPKEVVEVVKDTLG